MTVFAETIQFVGGKGDDRSDTNGGGFVVGGTATYDTFQTATGGPTSDSDTWNGIQTACNVTSDGGKVNLEVVGGGDGEFDNCVVGTVAYVMFEGEYIDGYYEVITNNGDDITIDLTWTANVTADIHVGGALATLQYALDNISAADYDRQILVNLNTVRTTATLGDDVGGGSVVKNTKRRVIAYNTMPGDMSKGGAYYQSPIESYRDGISSDSFRTIDANGGTFPVLTVDGNDNVVWENFFLKNTSKAAGMDAIAFVGTPINTFFKNCRFDSVYKAVATVATGTTFLGCANGPNIAQQPVVVGFGGMLVDNVWQEAEDPAASVLGLRYDNSNVVTGCIIIGGYNGVRAMGLNLIAGNTFYNQSNAAILIERVDAAVTVYNNILVVQAGARAILISTIGGSLAYNDYNCIIDTTGSPLAVPVDSDYVGGTKPVLGGHSIEVDPRFVNVSAGDFRPSNMLLMRSGRSDVYGMPGLIGAGNRQLRFVGRSQVMCPGRLGIMR